MCPLPPGSEPRKTSLKALLIPLIAYVSLVGVVALVSTTGALWLLGIYCTLAILSMIYRAIRGHNLKCVLIWGPVSALYWIGDGIASATP